MISTSEREGMEAIHSTKQHGRSRWLCALVVLLPFLHGCRGNCDLVEADLRAKEALLDQLRGELNQRNCNIQALEMEIARLQAQQCARVGSLPTPPPGMIIKQVKLGRLTGGFDDDPLQCGDEGLQVLLEPRDCDDQSVKAPGSLRLEVYEITQQGLKVPLSSWDFPPAELRRTWDTPVFGGPAYRITVPWKSWPATEKLRVVARFTTLDGQQFEADKDVSIRLAPERLVNREPRVPVFETSGPHLGTPPDPELLAPPSPSDVPPPPEDPMPPATPVYQRPSEVAPASFVRPMSETPRPRPPSPAPVNLEKPIKANWKPVR